MATKKYNVSYEPKDASNIIYVICVKLIVLDRTDKFQIRRSSPIEVNINRDGRADSEWFEQ